MELGLHGKTALVTGASKGIGEAIAHGLAAEGCELVLVARSSEALERVASRLSCQHGVKVTSIAADLSASADMAALLAEAPPIDVLVNNAGAIPGGSLAAISDAAAHSAMDLKLFSYMALSRHYFGQMSQRRSGVILNVIGTAGDRPRAQYALGSMVNASLVAMTRALGLQGSLHGVRVVGLHPGATRTERKLTQLKDRAQREFAASDRWRELAAKYPYGRLAEPSEIAAAAVFLCSQAASYINGTCLTVDGGATDEMV